ncbi:MAG TPA: DUF4129 domain-containing protein [Acidimicrobiia bacterium]|nr:DUF4129 domain-containing protein [Acidimicrobiia bacterium]
MIARAAALAAAVDPDAARRNAKDILGERRFRPERVPRPFAGALRWLGRRLEPVGRVLAPVGRFFETRLGIAVLALVVVAATVVVARLLASRSGARATARGSARAAPRGPEDPELLERQADDAEACGDYSSAVRLRFRAGLLRLDRAGAIRLGPSLTAGQVARRLALDDFDAVAREFETVAYGNHDADHDAADAARRGWSRVLATVGNR